MDTADGGREDTKPYVPCDPNLTYLYAQGGGREEAPPCSAPGGESGLRFIFSFIVLHQFKIFYTCIMIITQKLV